MTLLQSSPTASRYESPSAALAVARELLPPWQAIVISGALAGHSTSSREPLDLYSAPSAFVSNATTSYLGYAVETAAVQVEPTNAITATAITELRRRSGLTWEQLAQLFGVARRSVHFWASGNPLNADNERQLFQVLDLIRTADRGEARVTRAALMNVEGGTSAFDLLTARRFADAASKLGAGVASNRPALGPLSHAAKAARAPLPPAELMATADDRVHREPGHARGARTVRRSGRGTA